MTRYKIKYKEIEYRFDTKEQAIHFYELNKCDYMDYPEEVDIVDVSSWHDNSIHPYDKETDRVLTLADGFLL